jgi:hypothetical protein
LPILIARRICVAHHGRARTLLRVLRCAKLRNTALLRVPSRPGTVSTRG